MSPTSSDLAFVADALLNLIGSDASAPFYDEASFVDRNRKLAGRQSRFEDPTWMELAAKSGDRMLFAECRDVFASCQFTPRQREVLDLWLVGYTFEEIGRYTSSTKQNAMTICSQAMKKVGRAIRSYTYRGLSDCYREELRRGVRRVR